MSEETTAVSARTPAPTGHRRWADYIRSLSERKLVASPACLTADFIWRNLQLEVPGIYPPDTSPTDDGTLMMSWIRDEHHLEIEVMPSGHYVWFYKNHELNLDDIGKGSPTDEPSPAFVEKARLVFA